METYDDINEYQREGKMDVCRMINDVIVTISTRIYRILARIRSMCWRPCWEEDIKKRYRSRREEFNYRRRNKAEKNERCPSLSWTV